MNAREGRQLSHRSKSSCGLGRRVALYVREFYFPTKTGPHGAYELGE